MACKKHELSFKFILHKKTYLLYYNPMKSISYTDLVPMDIFVEREPIKIDLVYAQANHPRNIFNTALYHYKARLWAHKEIAVLILLAARKLNKQHNYTLEIQDCLRTVDSQEAMHATELVKANPQWCTSPNRLLAPAGAGGHPHAMAVDVRVLDADDQELDMGTQFDTMTEQSHRNYTEFSANILENRKILENAFMDSAKTMGAPFIALSSEWWDFRFTGAYLENLMPLRDVNLPPQMQMTQKIANNIPDLSQEHFDKLAEDIITIVDANI